MKVFVLAETASNWAAAMALPYVKKSLEKRGVAQVIRKIKQPGEARLLSSEAVELGMDVVLVVGGDDIVSEAAKSLASTKTALAVMPCGPKQGLARSLGLPITPDSIAESIVALSHVSLDMGMVDSNPFLHTVTAGFSARAALHASKSSVFLPSPRPYFIDKLSSGVAALFTHRSGEFIIRHDTGVEKIRATTISVSNSRYYATHDVSPQASLIDGLLDVYILEETSRGRLAMGVRGHSGAHVGNDISCYTHIKSRYVDIEDASGGPIAVDGRHAGSLPARFGIIPRSLKLIVPDIIRNEMEPSGPGIGAKGPTSTKGRHKIFNEESDRIAA